MGFIVVDGFDDRYWLTNGYNYGDIFDGWGLYALLYTGDGAIYHPEYGGNRELGRYGGWTMMLADDDMAQSYCLLEVLNPSGKDWCGGMAINSGMNDGDIFMGISGTKTGPIIEFDRAGEITVRREKQFASTTEIAVRSDDSARITMWGWHYVTFQFHCGDIGADWIKIWIDGEKVVDVSGTTLNYGGTLDSVETPHTVVAADDIWLRDDTNVIDEPVIPAIFPDGVGTDTECTPVGSANNWENVNEFEQDFDSSYNLVAAAEKDSFSMGSLSAQVSAGIVHALVARFFVKGDVGNALQLRPYVISGGSKYNGTAQNVVEGRYTYIQEIWETNPDTASAWTVGELDTVQIGYEAV